MTTKQPELSDLDEVAYLFESDSYMFDSASGGTRFVHSGKALYEQIAQIIKDWEPEDCGEMVVYHRPQMVIKHRNSGGHTGRG